jgi:phage terminase Nu1 subunit (DNA packaging protein)
MGSMRAGDDVNVTFTPEGEEALNELAEAMAATYDSSPESLERLIRCLNTADVDDLARDLSVIANDPTSVDEVARRRLSAQQARTIPEAGTTDRQLPSQGW